MTIDKTIAFRDDMLDLILAGNKTVTIRPMKPQPKYMLVKRPGYLSQEGEWNGVALRDKKDLKWLESQYPHGKTGDIVTVRGCDDIKLKLTKIWTAEIYNLSTEAWRRDGLDLAADVVSRKRHWDSFYGDTRYRWEMNPFAWVISFALVRRGQP